jgi:hypothetical protein
MIDSAMLSETFRLAAKRHFSASDLWSSLAMRIAEDPDVLNVARVANPKAFPPYLLMTAVHRLVLAEPDCELAQFFPTVSTQPPPSSNPYPVFKAFVLGARKQITTLIQSANVNKTIVKRSACLRALLVDVANKKGWDRVHLVDIGCGAGLNLFLDNWRITYRGLGEVGPSDSGVHFSIEVRDGSPPPLGELPRLLTRTGIDLDRFDLEDAAQEQWLLGSLFPDHPDIFDLTKRALDVLRLQPPNFVTGNAGDELAQVLIELPGNEPVVVMHSMALFQMSPKQKQSVHQALRQAGQMRPVAKIGMEIVGSQTRLIAASLDDAEPLAAGEADDDAAWMRWY